MAVQYGLQLDNMCLRGAQLGLLRPFPPSSTSLSFFVDWTVANVNQKSRTKTDAAHRPINAPERCGCRCVRWPVLARFLGLPAKASQIAIYPLRTGDNSLQYEYKGIGVLLRLLFIHEVVCLYRSGFFGRLDSDTVRRTI